MRDNREILRGLLQHTDLNVSAGISRLGEDSDLYRKLLVRFISDHSRDMAHLQSFLVDEDRGSVVRLIHSLRSATGHIGADSISQRLRSLLQELKGKAALKDLSYEFEVLISEYNSLFAELEKTDFLSINTEFSMVCIPKDLEMNPDTLLLSLKGLAGYLELQQPGESLGSVNDLISVAGNAVLKESLIEVKQMIENYNFSDSHILVQNIIKSFTED